MSEFRRVLILAYGIDQLSSLSVVEASCSDVVCSQSFPSHLHSPHCHERRDISSPYDIDSHHKIDIPEAWLCKDNHEQSNNPNYDILHLSAGNSNTEGNPYLLADLLVLGLKGYQVSSPLLFHQLLLVVPFRPR